ncbi:MAG: phospho-sugar mutase [Clostridia bacterium]|nr:phospho-sugar mutase [Clostridia bacterium]
MSENNYLAAYERWLCEPTVDESTKAELRSICDDNEAIKQRFISYLTFGTAGLRGTMNAGTNAMNAYTVAHATQGMAALISQRGEACKARGVVIAYDSRLNSKLFAEISAEVLTANGIKVYLFDALRPTPLLSYAIGALNCIAGINITASHNPKQYNGYKAYWEDGAQISPEQADIVSAAIAANDIFRDVHRIPLKDALATGLLEYIGAELDESYLQCVQKQAVNPQAVAEAADALSVVYTPLHGTGYRLVPEVLRRIGVKHLFTVDEQMVIDGSFPTVSFPNPEYPEVFALGIEKAKSVGSDLIIATDPDADRVGIMAKGKDGMFHCLTGNQMGVLLLDYIITALKQKGQLPENAYAIKSIVSTEMATKVCRENGVTMLQTFTGFKYIGEKIIEQKQHGNDGFLFAFEESYGYLRGDYAKDKDAVVATMLIVEMAAYYHAKKMTLIDAMDDVYQRYGHYRDGVENLYMEGLTGLENMRRLMQSLRNDPPRAFGNIRIVKMLDYLSQRVTCFDSGTTENTGMDTADVLSFVTQENDTIVIRPSGTEPKIKIYFLVSATTAKDADRKLGIYRPAIQNLTKI